MTRLLHFPRHTMILTRQDPRRFFKVHRAIAAGLACATLSVCAQEVRSFRQTTDTGIVFAPPDTAPSISVSLEVPRIEAPLDISTVQYSISTKLYLTGFATTESVVARTFSIQAQADFTVGLPGSSIQQSPNVLLSGVVLAAPDVAEFNGESSLGTLEGTLSKSLFIGSGLVTIPITAVLHDGSPGAQWHNLTQSGGSSPYTYINDPKVFTADNVVGYRLVQDVTITMTVIPEASTWGAIGMVTSAVAFAFWRRRRA